VNGVYRALPVAVLSKCRSLDSLRSLGMTATRCARSG
jgi:hypothetical protein